VIGPSGAMRLLVATRPVDFRKGAEGLAALFREDRHTRAAQKAGFKPEQIVSLVLAGSAAFPRSRRLSCP
jgi:hypothetical protein